MTRPLPICVDSREQVPYRFDGYEIEVTVEALPSADYSLLGFENTVGIERKSLDDLVACLQGENRSRFERELRRLQHYELKAVIIEAGVQDVRRHNYRSKMSPHAVLQSLCAFTVRYGIGFWWAGDREGGEYIVYSLLSKFDREIRERFKLLTRRPRQGPAGES